MSKGVYIRYKSRCGGDHPDLDARECRRCYTLNRQIAAENERSKRLAEAARKRIELGRQVYGDAYRGQSLEYYGQHYSARFQRYSCNTGWKRAYLERSCQVCKSDKPESGFAPIYSEKKKLVLLCWKCYSLEEQKC